MTLNASKAGKTRVFETLEAGPYPARLVQVIDMGLQEQRPYKGEEKAPAKEIMFTYEHSDEFIPDENGEPDPERPRFISEFMPLNNLRAIKAKSTARYKVLDPETKDGGDFVKQLGKPCMIVLTENAKADGTKRNYVAGITSMRAKDAEKLPPLVNKPVFFDLDAPDMEVFHKLPDWVKNKIKANLEFVGSPLAALLGDGGVPEKKEEKPIAQQLDDENPY